MRDSEYEKDTDKISLIMDSQLKPSANNFEHGFES